MSRLRTPLGPDDHRAGPRDAPFQLVEYGDFECPSCGWAFPQVERVRRALGDGLLFAFRHFPLTAAHPHALEAAEAAEAAAAQGRFWQMHRLLFEHQAALGRGALVSCAEALGLDVDRFTADLDAHRYERKIRRQLLDGARSGVNGTPTFFVNGVRHDGPFDAASLREAIEGTSPRPAP